MHHLYHYYIYFVLTLFFSYNCNSEGLNNSHSIITNGSFLSLDTSNSIDNDSHSYINQIKGSASYYAHRFHKRKTASGDRYDMYDYTAAHRKIPFGTIAKITNYNNNKSVLVKINDRGPYRTKHILDLSYRAAKDISGLHSINIYLIYFDFNKLVKEFDTNYFAGHAVDRDFKVFHKSEIRLLDSIYTSNFEEVLTSYHQYQLFPNYECYILTKIKNPKNKEMFYIGTTKKNLYNNSYLSN